MVGGGSDRGGGSGGGGGRRGRRGFSGALSESTRPSASSSSSSSSPSNNRGSARGRGGKGGNARSTHDTPPHMMQTQAAAEPQAIPAGKEQQRSVAPLLDASPALDGETCFICAEPVKLYSVPPCNHKTCHICAIRLRVLYKKQDCTFCKAPSESLIFTSQTEKDYLSFNATEIPFKDERLNIYFETEQSRDETLVLLHFNCPDSTCEYAGASWPDLKAHVRSEHGTLFCELCVRNSHIFVHEHALYASSALAQHIRVDHKHCEFCNRDFYSDDELYIHMRDRHEQCFLCKRHDETRHEYHRDYAALEKHFKHRHFLCDAKQCLEQKFVVFESEMDFKAHQVAEHGGELSSREKREALRVTANFRYDPNSTQARGAGASTTGSTGYTPRGRLREDIGSTEEGASSSNTDGASSTLASRAHVPGAGGGTSHQSRRANFGSGLTTSGKVKEDEEAVAKRAAAEEKTRQTQVFLGRVAEIVHHSDVKMHSIRTNLKTFEAGEMSARDLISSVQSIVDDSNQVETIVKGVVQVLERHEQKQEMLEAWTTVQVEQTHFPSLGGGSATATGSTHWVSSRGLNAGLSTITRGQVRSIKINSAAANRGVWANVEAAASSTGSVYRNVARAAPPASTSRAHNFPSLASNSRVVPGSAAHSSRTNAIARSTAPWAASASGGASSSSSSAPQSGRGTPTPKPFSVDVSRDVARNNQTSIRSNASAFPSLPVNANAVHLAAQKKQLFANKRSTGSSGAATPSGPAGEPWARSGVGRIDGAGGDAVMTQDELDAFALHERLSDAAHISDAAQASRANKAGSTKKGKQQKKVLVTMGGVHRG